MEKQVKLLLYRLQGLKMETTSTATTHRDCRPIQMFFISPVKGERVQSFYIMKSNIASAVHA